jgi:hypothetical protein
VNIIPFDGPVGMATAVCMAPLPGLKPVTTAPKSKETLVSMAENVQLREDLRASNVIFLALFAILNIYSTTIRHWFFF